MPLRIAHLRRRSDFLRISSSGHRSATPGLVLQAAPTTEEGNNGHECVRVGFTASKRVGGAVARNRAKRRLRATVARVMPFQAELGQDYVVIARARTLTRSFEDLVRDLENALRRLHGHRDPDAKSGEKRREQRKTRSHGRG